MSVQPILPPPVSPVVVSGRVVRVEYVDFRDLEAHREYHFRVYGADGAGEFRVRIANDAFAAGRVRRQDGPDVCYQKLLRTIAAVEAPNPDTITIDDADLLSYRDDHTVVRKRRSPPASSSPATPVAAPRRREFRPRTPAAAAPQLPVPAASDVEPALGDGQRVNHAIFGIGVTTATNRARTVIRFDRDGPKTFVTSLLEVEVLSAPHTWETSPRGPNRLCRKTPPSA